MWEASDLQWWWRRSRVTDDLALPVWFDEFGPVAAAGLTAWEETWQADVFVAPSIVNEQEVWVATLEAAAGHGGGALEVLLSENDTTLVELVIGSGFVTEDHDVSGTAWMDATALPLVTTVDGFSIVNRAAPSGRPHPMTARNGELVEQRLSQCSLYDPTFDLSVEDWDGALAGYALFWFDPITLDVYKRQLVNEPSDLETLAHGVEFGRGAEVAHERGHGRGIAKSGKGLDEFVEPRRGLGARLGGNYFSTGHAQMLAC